MDRHGASRTTQRAPFGERFKVAVSTRVVALTKVANQRGERRKQHKGVKRRVACQLIQNKRAVDLGCQYVATFTFGGQQRSINAACSMNHAVQCAVLCVNTLSHPLHGHAIRHIGTHEFNVAPRRFSRRMATGDDHSGIEKRDQPASQLQANAPGTPTDPPHARTTQWCNRPRQNQWKKAVCCTNAIGVTKLGSINGGVQLTCNCDNRIC